MLAYFRIYLSRVLIDINSYWVGKKVISVFERLKSILSHSTVIVQIINKKSVLIRKEDNNDNKQC